MVTSAEVTFVTWAANRLLSIMKNDTARAEQSRIRVATYFDAVGACLHEMSTSLSSGAIPREAGHALEVLMDSFNITMASNFYGRHDLKEKEGEGLLQDLRTLANDARVADIHIREGKLMVSGMSQKQAVEALQRASGRFRGLAATLRAVGPFNAQKKGV